MAQWNYPDFAEKRLFFAAAPIPLPPALPRVPKTGQSRHAGTPSAQFARYYTEATEALGQAQVHDFGLIVAIQESCFRIPIVAWLKLYAASLWGQEVEGQANQVVSVTLRFLHLTKNPIVELRIQRFIDASNPHAEIALYCASSWW